MRIGGMYNRYGRYEKAVEMLKHAIRLKPDYYEAYVILGPPLSELERYSEAVEVLEKAIRLNPNNSSAYINLSSTLGYQNQQKKAIEVLKKALLIDPDNSAIHNNLGIDYLSIGDRTSALKEYEVLKNLDMASADRLLERIEASKKTDQEDEK